MEKIIVLKQPPRRIWTFFIVSLIAYSGTMGVCMAGDIFLKQGTALYKALNEYLILKGFCDTDQSCHNLHQIYREDSSEHIYLNMYGQTNKVLSAVVAEFLVANGTKISGGLPITLKVFEGPKTQYLGIKSMIGKSQEFIKLEISK